MVECLFLHVYVIHILKYLCMKYNVANKTKIHKIKPCHLYVILTVLISLHTNKTIYYNMKLTNFQLSFQVLLKDSVENTLVKQK